MIGIIVTFIGVLTTVFAVGISSSLSIIGYLALIIAVLSYAFYSVNVEKAVSYTGEEITFVMLFAGTVTFVSLALIESFFLNNTVGLLKLPFVYPHFLSACIYQGIGCSVIASFLSNVAISKIGVNRASSFLGISTVVSIIAGVLILKEPFSILQIVGVILIITGVYTANSRINW